MVEMRTRLGISPTRRRSKRIIAKQLIEVMQASGLKRDEIDEIINKRLDISQGLEQDYWKNRQRRKLGNWLKSSVVFTLVFGSFLFMALMRIWMRGTWNECECLE
ncbi:unnamed protein product [Nezara viridula]|uniref:Uncharacterized protein n=1 Tax=Nezara viridula TaxID=85310 RepID=A0A9P0GY74_NEZVI|nr:unnamed protein product [Nezara viridula]